MRAPLLLLAPVLALLACAGAKPKPAGSPALLSQALQVARQDLTQVALRLEGEVQHPGEAVLESATWELVSDGQVVQRGETKLDVALKPGAATRFSLPVERTYVQGPEALQALSQKSGQLLLALRGTLQVRSAGSVQPLPFAASRAVRTPRLPTVRVERLDAARYGPEEVTLTVGLGVDNPNPFPLRLSGLTWALGVAGKGLADGNALQHDTVAAASTGVYDVEASLTKETYGADVRPLTRKGALPYALKGTLSGEGFQVPYALAGEVKLGGSR
ncbi:hypothetical protein FGE12_14490 [Aggregicoccus sp. 17bor-14]|uniref:LEA type 2 family protein n=1 Tax=Myxococcaceae TaxID=31 RepID=UPI00129C6D6D|nr:MULTISPECIES: LEA type 2 family protein [Myxococcaceae]MBF5043602.1 LEA type 2 family protein [Simulacricoccus sp. 17bor-14]MRI89361.1 hypothetical protein [Aggregicoccus sp. 17bor-14]